MSKGHSVQKPFWVIKNVKKNSIWRKPFLSRSEAEGELLQQIEMLMPEKREEAKTRWMIEECSFWGQSDGLDDFE